MDQKTFSQHCISHGFSKVGSHYYARCIGDGVFQTIYTGKKEYVDPSSPNYSSQNRKSNMIALGVASLYSPWNESLFAPGIHSGLYYPDQFLSDPPKVRIFHGYSDECIKMQEIVLDVLDTINTQEKMLDLYCNVRISKSGARIHDSSLVAPFLMCGKTEDAIFELCYQYMHCREGFRKTHMEIRHTMDFEVFYQQELEILDRLSITTELWDAILCQKYDRIQSYLIQNYERNMCWTDKYRIAKMGDFFFRNIPKVF